MLGIVTGFPPEDDRASHDVPSYLGKRPRGSVGSSDKRGNVGLPVIQASPVRPLCSSQESCVFAPNTDRLATGRPDLLPVKKRG